MAVSPRLVGQDGDRAPRLATPRWEGAAPGGGVDPPAARRSSSCARRPAAAHRTSARQSPASRLDAEVLASVTAQPTPLADALTALAGGVTAYRRRSTRPVPAWTLIGVYTAGRLLPARSGQSTSGNPGT